jgi:hypothetical protein
MPLPPLPLPTSPRTLTNARETLDARVWPPQYGSRLPNERRAESEADATGFAICAKACFDPQQVTAL